MKHTKESILKEIHEAVKSNPATIYKQDFAKRYGRNQVYSEIAAQELLHLFGLGKINITKGDRTDYCYIEEHRELAKLTRPEKCVAEKWDAREMLKKKKEFNDIGKIIDFEIPLTLNTRENIDLLAYDCKDKKLSLLEYKTAVNKEPLLRCVLEIYTYRQRINEEAFFDSYKNYTDNCKSLRTVVFVHQDSLPYKQFFQAKDTVIRELMKALQVELFSIEEKKLYKA